MINDGIKNERSYDFDYIFDKETGQSDVFDYFKDKLFENAVNGVNYCLMAYG